MSTIQNHTPVKFRRLMIAAAATLLASAIANAAPTSWTPASGDAGTFSYSNGQSLNGNFGNGTAISGTGFFTSPTGLIASASSSFDSMLPANASASDTLSVILNAKPMTQFGSISTTILGDYAHDGFSMVGASGELRVYNLDNLSASPQVMDLSFTGLPTSPILGQSNGAFAGTAALALPNGWTNIRVELDGAVTADALFGASSTIQAKDVSIDVATAPLRTSEIPLPAAAFAAPALGAVAFKLRRKFVRR